MVTKEATLSGCVTTGQQTVERIITSAFGMTLLGTSGRVQGGDWLKLRL
jgi:hypothetical protein